ncbi:MAG: hypothetical protein U0Q15_01820 [Kineosporiaceae bacterium]
MPNLVEDRPFVASDGGVLGGDNRQVHILVTGGPHCLEGREVFAVDSEAQARAQEWRVRGVLDARVVDAVANTWMVDADGRPIVG